MDKKRNGHTLQTGTGHLYLAMAEGTTDGWELGIVLAMIQEKSQTGWATGGATKSPGGDDLDCGGRKAIDPLHLTAMRYTTGCFTCAVPRAVRFLAFTCYLHCLGMLVSQYVFRLGRRERALRPRCRL